MKKPDGVTVQKPSNPTEHEKVLLNKIVRYCNGEKVRGDDLMRAGLFLCGEVTRSLDTPYFAVERLREFLERIEKLASKQFHMLQGWPGVELDNFFVDDTKRKLGFFRKFISFAPKRGDCCDD